MGQAMTKLPMLRATVPNGQRSAMHGPGDARQVTRTAKLIAEKPYPIVTLGLGERGRQVDTIDFKPKIKAQPSTIALDPLGQHRIATA